jgi:hypothetical protein
MSADLIKTHKKTMFKTLRSKLRDQKFVKKLILIEAGFILIISVATVGVVGWFATDSKQTVPELAVLPTPIITVTPSKNFLVEVAKPGAELEPIDINDPLVFPTQSVQDILSNPTPTPLPAHLPTPVPVCGGPTELIILGVGVDTRGTGYTYGLADVIRIARFDFVNPKVTVIALPRDLWVEIPGLEEASGITHGKLNQAYYYGLPSVGIYPQPDGGPNLLTQTLDHRSQVKVLEDLSRERG